MANDKLLHSISNLDFEVLKEYMSTGDSRALSPERQRMLKICRDTWGLMEKYPQRSALIHQLIAMHGLSYKTAVKYVDFTRSTWGNYVDINHSFLNTFFLQSLMKALSNPHASETARAKNLATMQKYLQAMPQSEVDPRLMEANQIIIQFGTGDNAVAVAQHELARLPKEIQERLFSSAARTDITEAEAIEILES